MQYALAVVDVQDLLKKFVTWVLGQSKQLAESRIEGDNDFQVPGYRIMKLKRKTARAVTTWRIYCYKAGYNLEIGCDTLQNVAGTEPVRKANKLATHLINIVKINYEVAVDETGKRKPHKETLMNDECIMEAAYRASKHDLAATIVNESMRLFHRMPDKYQPYSTAEGWRHLFTESARHYLGSDTHQLFPRKEQRRSPSDNSIYPNWIDGL